MAGIDKIYCDSKESYDEFMKWVRDNRKDCISATGEDMVDYIYPIQDTTFQSGKETPIANFPRVIDMWILANCPIIWVNKKIARKYL